MTYHTIHFLLPLLLFAVFYFLTKETVNVYFTSRASSVWEVKLISNTTKNDSLEFQVVKTDLNSTRIRTVHEDWSKDVLGSYLKKISSYKNPVHADTSANYDFNE
ncbi:MAG: hypothetical protein ABI402_14000 [Ferruginibacter sp.]